jgi:RNA polymerase sigma-70 factor (ECF subfamily)
MAFRYVYSQFNNYDETMDITQDIFIMSLEALKSFRKESKFSTWFFSIMVNYCKNYRKKSRRYNTIPINGTRDEEDYEMQIPDERSDPESTVITDESFAYVREEFTAA